MTDTSDEIVALKAQLAAAETKAKEVETMMIQAAQYGKDLLEKNIELETNIDKCIQDKHELQLKLQVGIGALCPKKTCSCCIDGK